MPLSTVMRGHAAGAEPSSVLTPVIVSVDPSGAVACALAQDRPTEILTPSHDASHEFQARDTTSQRLHGVRVRTGFASIQHKGDFIRSLQRG
jgi:hypothetical protein